MVYLRGHEGRGIGLLAKIDAYALQDAGRDTVQANLDLGLPADRREYGAAAAILADLGLRSVRLLTNNPAKVAGLRAHGIEVDEVVPHEVGRTPENAAYLEDQGGGDGPPARRRTEETMSGAGAPEPPAGRRGPAGRSWSRRAGTGR